MDISNRTLMWLLILAIAISLWGTMTSLSKLQRLSITGAVSANGTAQLYINTSLGIIFAVDTVDWGSGYVNQSAADWCLLNTTGGKTSGCAEFNTVTQGLVIENTGNAVFSSVQLRSEKNATEFLGEDCSAVFQWKISENETGSCGTLHDTSWTDVNTSDPGTTICENFQFANDQDSLLVDLQINFTYQIPTGSKTTQLVVTGTQ